jgi:hypothetical protein
MIVSIPQQLKCSKVGTAIKAAVDSLSAHNVSNLSFTRVN